MASLSVVSLFQFQAGRLLTDGITEGILKVKLEDQGEMGICLEFNDIGLGILCAPSELYELWLKCRAL